MRIKKFVIDLDGTLAFWESGVDDLSEIGDPLPGAVEFVNKLAEDGSKITIFTRRLSEDIFDNDDEKYDMLAMIEGWLDKHGFIWHNVFYGQGKPDGTCFIDDRGVACRPQDNPNAYSEALDYINKRILKKMNIGFDIGGVLSKYPNQMRDLADRFRWTIHRSCEGDWQDNIKDIYVITDQHPKEKVLQVLKDNDFEFILSDNVLVADYEKYGNIAKAVLIKEYNIDIFIDDFEVYLSWDSTLGPQPILLKIMPDVFKPYWSKYWKQEGNDFGRRFYNVN